MVYDESASQHDSIVVPVCRRSLHFARIDVEVSFGLVAKDEEASKFSLPRWISSD